ncbi:MAG: TetR family transcriptional regulator C-terminal domain-containing protein [Cyclobacteriaceae bacterium]
MAKTATKSGTTTKTSTKEKIIAAYKEHKLMHGSRPASVFAFTKSMKISEQQFFELFSSFDDLEAYIWDDMIGQVMTIVHNDENYAQFNIREKLLSFYYTFLEVLKANRSYVLMEKLPGNPGTREPAAFNRMKDTFLGYVHGLMIEGNDTGEIPRRPFFSDKYKHGFWMQLLFIMNFWKNDNSKDFEKTDAAVEKTVNVSLDLIEKGPLDSIVDFAKFLYQNKG